MGQKVNPHGLRVGVIKDWDSRWFASKKDFSDNLVEDHKIRTELKALLKDAGVPKIEIERTVDSSTSAPALPRTSTAPSPAWCSVRAARSAPRSSPSLPRSPASTSGSTALW